MKRAIAVAALLWPVCASPASAQETTYGLPLEGEAAEAFLRTAKVVGTKALGTGVTHADRLTLTEGGRTCRAIRKTINEFRPGATSLEGLGVVVDFEDSYRFEIAAYELDKLLGLGLVPPTVERALEHRKGSLQMWVEGAMTEWDRSKKGPQPPDIEAWNAQIYKVRLLHGLAFDWDAQNTQNVLLDPTFRVYAVDFSRSFAAYDQPRNEKLLDRFSRAALESLKKLDRPTLEAKLGKWISPSQIGALLKRRDRILVLAAERVEEKGEAAVLYP
jgi:hypothetical protein